MWPASNSSVSCTSTSTAPLAAWRCTSAGSTSSIWLRICLMTSGPEGLMADSTGVGFTSESIAWARVRGPELTPPGRDYAWPVCGIAGIHAPGNHADPRVVAAMVARLVHRGPDGGGFHDAPGIALGMRRLAIIDPEGGDQPLRSEDGEIVAVFNGELYNHTELRAGLERRGHRLRSNSDGEVIPHLYEEHGPGFVERL